MQYTIEDLKTVDTLNDIKKFVYSFMKVTDNKLYKDLSDEYIIAAYMSDAKYLRVLSDLVNALGFKSKFIGLINRSYNETEFDCMQVHDAMLDIYSKSDYNISNLTVLEFEPSMQDLFVIFIKKNKHTGCNSMIGITIK